VGLKTEEKGIQTACTQIFRILHTYTNGYSIYTSTGGVLGGEILTLFYSTP